MITRDGCFSVCGSLVTAAWPIFSSAVAPTLALTLALGGCAMKTVYDPQADREGIRNVVHEHFKEVERCYLVAIEARPGAEGKFVASWEIGPEGQVLSAARKEADPKITAVEPCLLGAIKSWTFPKPDPSEGTVSVAYPFFFSENGHFGAAPGQ